MNILIIDDSKDLGETLKMALEEETGLTVKYCSCPAEAIKLVKTELKYEIVISDFNMPKMDGVDLLNSLTKSYLFKGAILSGTVSDPDVEKIRKSGYKHFRKGSGNLGEIINFIEQS